MRTPSVGSEAVVEVVGDYLDLVVYGDPGPVGSLQCVRIDLGDRGVRGVLDIAKEDALQDRVRGLVVKFRSSEWPVSIGLVLLFLRGIIVGQEYGAVDGWVAGECLVGNGDGRGLGAAQYLTGQSTVCFISVKVVT